MAREECNSITCANGFPVIVTFASWQDKNTSEKLCRTSCRQKARASSAVSPLRLQRGGCLAFLLLMFDSCQYQTRRVYIPFSLLEGTLLLLLLLLLKSSLSQSWSERMNGIISNFFYLLRLVLWPIMWQILEKVPWGAEKNIYCLLFWWNVLYISTTSICFIISISFTVSLWFLLQWPFH